MMMRRVYCGAQECARGEHVWENGMRFHYEPIHDYPSKEESMSEQGKWEKWELPNIDWQGWGKGPNTGTTTDPHIHYEPSQSAQRMAILIEVIATLKQEKFECTIQDVLAVAEWVTARGF